ncbi:hypothetical protein UPYG_G00328400 [Umbra pygmaea]|uniref:Leucine-rich repeat-containing protein 20 n=1 Tax=Umbra pygmaea TaxID=75934 RepID=A0ABD0WH13_UMBPY
MVLWQCGTSGTLKLSFTFEGLRHRTSTMGEAVANVARRVNATVEEEKDTLDLSNCKLISFPDGVFRVLKSVAENIQIITLADNEMKGVTGKFFKTFTQLRELDLHNNVINKLPDVIGELEHLTSINLANNKLTVFPDKLTEIQSLERINLEGNDITDIPMEKLNSMPALKCINLKSNPLDNNLLMAIHQFPQTFQIQTTTDN